jgi:hypothetical protein
MVNRQLERQQMNRERRMAEDEQFQKVRLMISFLCGSGIREVKNSDPG